PDALGLETRHLLDELDELAVAGADDLPDLCVVAVRVRLHLRAEPSPVLEQAHVGSAHRVERLLAGLAGGGLAEELEGPAQAAADAFEIQLLLGAEQAENVGLRDAGLARD